jgi:hypothetical protein
MKTKKKKKNLLGKSISVIPLPMQIICHIYNVVNHIRNVRDGKAPEIPIRCGSSNCEGLAGRECRSYKCQEGQVVRSIFWASGWNARNISRARVFPVKVDAVKIVVDDERRYIVCKRLSFRHGHALAEDGESVVVSRE